MEHVFFLFLSFYIFYLIFILINIAGLCIDNPSPINISQLSVSVIIAVRNGEKSIQFILQDLLAQDYKGNLEFIIVDDESSDKTKDIIRDIAKKHSQIKYISSTKGDKKLKFKKKALNAGIQSANNEILLFTDVDCRVQSSWVSSMLKSFNENIDYVIGFSRVKHKFGLVNLFQRIDFLMLMFSARAVVNLGFPLACSAQNQGYRKSMFTKVGGYTKISNLFMGDDSIFLQLCLNNKSKVRFCEHPGSYTFCRSEKKWKSLFLQRMRWAGDGNIMWRYNFLFYTIMLAAVLSNLFIFFLIFTYSAYVLFLILITKLIFELLFAIAGSWRFNERISVFDFIYWYCLNIPYICIMSFTSFFTPLLSWKNRKQ